MESVVALKRNFLVGESPSLGRCTRAHRWWVRVLGDATQQFKNNDVSH